MFANSFIETIFKLDEFSAPPVSRFKTLSKEKQRELLTKAGLK